jgi:malonate-semialdehyde dehydrogenase (acetylating)/methylmalonate-semialdehyde dehydrogenase
MEIVSHWIDGRASESNSGRQADVFNPATGEVQRHVALCHRG